MKVLMMSLVLMVMMFSFGNGNDKVGNYEKNLKDYNVNDYNFEEVNESVVVIDTLDKKHVNYNIPFNKQSVIGGFAIYSNSNNTEILKDFSVSFNSVDNLFDSIESVQIYIDDALLSEEYMAGNAVTFEDLNIAIYKDKKVNFYLKIKTTKYGKNHTKGSINGLTFNINNIILENKNTSVFSNNSYVKININPLNVVVETDSGYFNDEYGNYDIINLAKFVINVDDTDSISRDSGASLRMNVLNFAFENNMPELRGIQLLDSNNNIVYDSDDIVYGLNVINLKDSISSILQGEKVNFTLKGKIKPKVKYRNYSRNTGLLNIQWTILDDEEIYQSNFSDKYLHNI